MRKSVFLLLPTFVKMEDGRIVAMLTLKGKEIILMAVHKDYRGRGYASELIKSSGATSVCSYEGNDAARKLYEQNGFRLSRQKRTLLGTKLVFKK